ncbi:hypothetical protein TNCV_1511621 [Trichonephila clavipes]|nr:hypothetical protein TNCV_1511621 [Trichonephila clavipes]
MLGGPQVKYRWSSEFDELTAPNESARVTNEVVANPVGQNPQTLGPYARNIPLDQNCHFSLEAVTGLYRRYRYNLFLHALEVKDIKHVEVEYRVFEPLSNGG